MSVCTAVSFPDSTSTLDWGWVESSLAVTSCWLGDFEGEAICGKKIPGGKHVRMVEPMRIRLSKWWLEYLRM
jgi:hypothetical protein